MRRKDKEITDRQEIDEIISSCITCRIAMCNDGIPYIVTVNYGYEDNSLLIHSATEGKKLDMIRRNNHVCFEMETDCELRRSPVLGEWSMKYRSVIGWGRATIIEDSEAKIQALNVLMRHHKGPEGPYPQKVVDKVAIIRIDIDSLTGKRS